MGLIIPKTLYPPEDMKILDLAEVVSRSKGFSRAWQA
jgi:hypothetical protein